MKLETTEPNIKISHNKLLVEFYLGDLKKAEGFSKSLTNILDLDSQDIKLDLVYAYYNYALTLFHARQPNKCLKVLTMIWNLGHHHIEDSLFARVSLLIVNVLLDLNQSKRAKCALNAVERLRLNTEIESVGTEENDRQKNQFDFKEMLKLATIRVNLLCNEPVTIPILESSEYSVLKAHQYYLKNDYQMAARELSKPFNNNLYTAEINGENQNTCLANNMGLIHFSVRHYAMAVRFFQHALKFDQTAADMLTQDPTLVSMSAVRRVDILYNLGVSLLYLQKPKEAFDCLLIPLNNHHNNPRLWIRLAEACIMVHKENVKNETDINLATTSIGAGALRKFILPSFGQKHKS